MKFIKAALTVFLAAMLLSCEAVPKDPQSESAGRESTVPEANSYEMEDIADGFYTFLHGETVIYPHSGRVYAANPETEKFGWYDPMAGMAYTALPDCSAERIHVHGGEIFLLSGLTVTVTDADGTVLSSYTADELTAEGVHTETYLCGSAEHILLARVVMYANMQHDTFFTLIDRTDGTFRTAMREDVRLSNIESMKAENGGYVMLGFADHDTNRFSAVFYDPHRDTLEVIYTFDNYGETDYADGTVYGFNSSSAVAQFFSVTDGESQVLRSVDAAYFHNGAAERTGGDEQMRFSAADLFCTGYDMLLWDSRTGVLAVSDTMTAAGGETLWVYYPVNQIGTGKSTQFGDINYEMMRFEAEYGCNVRAGYYLAAEYADRIRMKLLAGETDMDVVYLDHCDSGDLFSAVLRYGLYLPLEGYSAVTDNYEAFCDGVREYMTADGHLIGVPYRFGTYGYIVTEEYRELGLPMPDSTWTLNDFWDICEQSAAFVGNGTALTASNQIYRIAEALIEEGCRAGFTDKAAIETAVVKIKDYYDRGVFLPFAEADSFLLESRMQIPAVPGNFANTKMNIAGAVPAPTVNGNRYAPLESFLFVYGKSENPDLAVQYLAMMSSPEFMYDLSHSRTCVMKDASGYYRLLDTGMNGGKERRETELSERDSLLLSLTPALLSGTEIQLTASEDSAEVLKDVFARLFADELTAEEAVGEIVTFAEYRYFE